MGDGHRLWQSRDDRLPVLGPLHEGEVLAFTSKIEALEHRRVPAATAPRQRLQGSQTLDRCRNTEVAGPAVRERDRLARCNPQRAPSLRDEVTDFAVTKALDGVFHYVGEEERSFRRDPFNLGGDVLRGILGGRRNGG